MVQPKDNYKEKRSENSAKPFRLYESRHIDGQMKTQKPHFWNEGCIKNGTTLSLFFQYIIYT
jgi:hypothetical protein